MELYEQLVVLFKNNSDKTIAAGAKAYMRGQFEFFGLKSEHRRTLQKKCFNKQQLPPKKEAIRTIKQLWKTPNRECQYAGQELYYLYANEMNKKDIEIIEYMLTHKSWWDTVDFIAANILGCYFILFPEKKKNVIRDWSNSNNIWLQRSLILFQLKYKEKTDNKLLSEIIKKHCSTSEFFLNKAIGWALRSYSKTNPVWVKRFIQNNKQLNPLSVREGSKYVQ